MDAFGVFEHKFIQQQCMYLKYKLIQVSFELKDIEVVFLSSIKDGERYYFINQKQQILFYFQANEFKGEEHDTVYVEKIRKKLDEIGIKY
ncbi:hypothetical protein [Vibrio campbellii]|uniref:hypothetical protein n=1 Tax=Vibrio campbellii TaxID=680 RepID=UPI00168CDF9E|nr:hypothetical protein [Vibrio campbellii]